MDRQNLHDGFNGLYEGGDHYNQAVCVCVCVWGEGEVLQGIMFAWGFEYCGVWFPLWIMGAVDCLGIRIILMV